MPGYGIIGRAVATGSAVTKFKTGDMMGVGGCMADACGTCDSCREGEEEYCEASCGLRHVAVQTAWVLGANKVLVSNAQKVMEAHELKADLFLTTVPNAFEGNNYTIAGSIIGGIAETRDARGAVILR